MIKEYISTTQAIAWGVMMFTWGLMTPVRSELLLNVIKILWATSMVIMLVLM